MGGRGAQIGVTRGQRYTSVGLPGTGLSCPEYHKPAARQARCDLCQPVHVHFPSWASWLLKIARIEKRPKPAFQKASTRIRRYKADLLEFVRSGGKVP